MTLRIFRYHLPLQFVWLAVAEAVLLAALPYLASWLLGVPISWATDGSTVLHALLFAAAAMIGFAAVGLYSPRQRLELGGQFARVLIGVSAAVLLVAVISFLVPVLAYGRLILLVTGLLAIPAILLVRLLFQRLVDLDRFKRRVLVYGAGRHASSIAALRRAADKRGFTLVGYVPAAGPEVIAVPSEQILSGEDGLAALCEQYAVEEIVVAVDDRRQRFPINELLECRLDGVDVIELVTFLERETGKVMLDVLHPSWFIFSEGFRRGRVHASLERTFDIFASLALLLVAWPLMLVTALAIKIEDGWRSSVLYRQLRVGQNGRPFRVMKFRSMTEGAEADGKARWAQVNDSRLTRVGAVIRKLRIDELPQLLNVLRGDMSLVGPRPERPEFVERLEQTIPFYRERHNLKPGVTGWAQLCYPYGSSERDALEKLQYDLYYVKNHTLLFYLAILVQTVEVVVWGKGAR